MPEELKVIVDRLLDIYSRIENDIGNLNNAVFGDRANPKETPGIRAELTQMNINMTLLNSTMVEMRDAMKRIVWVIVSAFITALCVLVFKGLN